MSNVMGLFQELVDNFFPMAHTQEPLGALKIINGEEANRLDSFQERSIDGLSARMRTLSEIINETSNLLNDTQAEINNLKRFQEQMHQVSPSLVPLLLTCLMLLQLELQQVVKEQQL
jgi:hypothetical protein